MSSKNLKIQLEIISQIILVLGTIASILYVMGKFYFQAYYSALNIPQNFIVYSYHDIVFRGFALNLSISFGLFLFILWYFMVLRKNKEEKLLAFAKLHREDDQKIAELENNLIDARENITWVFRQLKVLLIAAAVYFTMALFFYLRHSSDNALFFLMASIGLTLNYLIFLLVKRVIMGTSRNRTIKAILMFSLILLLIVLFPSAHGKIKAQILLSTDSEIYKITTLEDRILYSKLLYFGKENYFFIVNDKLNIFPSSQIIRLEKVK